MKHIILGAGNLGIDLYLKLEELGHDVTLFCSKKIEVFNCIEWSYGLYGVDMLKDYSPDVVWNCIGCGSVQEANDSMSAQFSLCVGLTQKLVVSFPGKFVITFGSNYATGTIDSLYALNKKFQDDLVSYYDKFKNREQVATVKCIEIGNLYGRHRPEGTLPYKLLKSFLKSSIVELPENLICPTPSDWVASEIARDLMPFLCSEMVFFHLAPKDKVSILDFARNLLEDPGCELSRIYRSKGINSYVPMVTNIERSHIVPHQFMPPTWSDLFKPYKKFYRDLFENVSQEFPQCPVDQESLQSQLPQLSQQSD